MKSDANTLLLSTTRKLLHSDGLAQLRKLVERAHPADLAYVFNFLAGVERDDFFAQISEEAAAQMLTEVEPRVRIEFLERREPNEIARLLEVMSSDDVADVLTELDDALRERVLEAMRRDELVTTQSLLEYDPESAGGLMLPDYFALDERRTASEAIGQLQADAGRTEMVFYLYVVNEHGHLVGVSSLRELVLSDPDRQLKDFMITDVIRVSVHTDQEEVARLIARYNLVALPVVDENQLVGVVTVDDIIDVIRSEATEDMMLMAGAGDQSVNDYGSLLTSARARLPWLIPSVIGGALAMAALLLYESSIARVVPIVAFVPLIMTLGGNISNQSAAIVTRGLPLKRSDLVELPRVFLAELSFGVLAGLVYGALFRAIAFAFTRGPVAAAAPMLYAHTVSRALAT